jgi:hypothetical protein
MVCIGSNHHFTNAAARQFERFRIFVPRYQHASQGARLRLLPRYCGLQRPEHGRGGVARTMNKSLMMREHLAGAADAAADE